jgi:hypothetical protein
VTASQPSRAELNRQALVIITVPLMFIGLLQPARALSRRLILRTLRLPQGLNAFLATQQPSGLG